MNQKLSKARIILLCSIPILVIIEFYLWVKVNILVAFLFFIVFGILIIKVYDRLNAKNNIK